jgi:hypothetical protein
MGDRVFDFWKLFSWQPRCPLVFCRTLIKKIIFTFLGKYVIVHILDILFYTFKFLSTWYFEKNVIFVVQIVDCIAVARRQKTKEIKVGDPQTPISEKSGKTCLNIDIRKKSEKLT